jgi:thiamine transporter ThiT
VASDEAAFAANWRTVVLADVALGLVVVVAGVVVGMVAQLLVGVVLVLVGAVYLALVARRVARWRRLRADAGLPDR